MTTVEPQEGRLEVLRALASKGLKRRVRPILDHGTTICRKLFELEDEIILRQDALDLLRESYAATRDEDLSSRDRRIYDREFTRRQKQLDVLSAKRDLLLEQYGEELIRSTYQHPDLIELARVVPSPQES
ncbi:MAG: hypothetical protein V3W41_15655 [Planctomycetota bacterium]